MTNAIFLEKLSYKKLFGFVALLLICLFTCVLIGGFIAPMPFTVDMALASKCLYKENLPWSFTRDNGKCISHYLGNPRVNLTTKNIVYTFQIPTLQDNTIFEYSSWQQNHIGLLMFDIEYDPKNIMDPNVELTLDAKLGYSNQRDQNKDWKLYDKSVEKRILNCDLEMQIEDGLNYHCKLVPLFAFGSKYNNYYLLNLKIPVDKQSEMNIGLGKINDIWLMVFNHNEGFTRVWLYMKIIFFPTILAIMIWFWKRVHMLGRKVLLLEQMLITIGFTISLLNFPIEFLTLYYEIPFMLLFYDIKQYIFYATLFSFWLVFVGQHLTGTQQTNLRTYRKHLRATTFLCTFLFMLSVYEKGAQLGLPFYSIWFSNSSSNLIFSLFELSMILGGIYILFLLYMICRVFYDINAQRSALPSMLNARRLNYECSMNRIKLLMITTLLCTILTLTGFILSQASEEDWKWNEDNNNFNYTSAFLVGVYGMWNIYIFALFIFYAPYYKYKPINIGVTYNLNDSTLLLNDLIN